ncbi:hypothetical protein KR084_011297 [Drosophila pseudotakahashii]|nr:hypothetical protein KR084_011297 [Drosophila pseudotakahashii]
MGKMSRASYSQDYIKAQIEAGVLRFSNKRSRSKVWDVFARIEDQSGAAIQDIVMCRTCSSLLKYHGCTSNMVRHKCYRTKVFSPQAEDPLGSSYEDREEDPSRGSEGSSAEDKSTDKVTQAVMEWCVSNCRPLNIGQDTGLRNLVSIILDIGSEYGRNVSVDDLLPETGVVAWNIDNWYQEKLKQASCDMSSIRTNGYSIAIAEEKQSSAESFYLSSTIHYIREGRKCTQLLGLSNVPKNNSSAVSDTYILKLIEGSLGVLECDLFDDDPIFVYDERTSFRSVFEGRKALFCINSLLHRVVEKAFSDVSELRSLLKKVREQVILGVLPTPTSSGLVEIYHILKSLEANWAIIANEDENVIEGCEIGGLVAINNLLAHFEKCCQTLESGTSPTLHLVIPHIHRLKKYCAGESSHAMEMDLKRALIDNIDWMVMPHVTKYHMMAHFLFPPTNRLLQFSQEERDDTIGSCQEFMKRYCFSQHTGRVEQILIKGEGELVTEQDIEPDDDLFSDFVATDSQEDKIAKEIRGYQAIQMAYTEGFNVLEWWHSNRTHFPLLFKTSCQILSIPASKEPSALVLSQASSLIKDPACGMDELHRVMFLKTNIGEVTEY